MRDQQRRVIIGDGRLTTLENQNATTITEFWDSIPSGTLSGTLSPAAGHEFVANQWEDGVDVIVTGITGGVPDLQPVYTAAGVLVTATLNTSTGAYVLSGEPAGADPVALVTAQLANPKTIAGFHDTSVTYSPANGDTVTHDYRLGNTLVINAPLTGTFTLAISNAPALATNALGLSVCVITGATVPTMSLPTGAVTFVLTASKDNVFTLTSFNKAGVIKWNVGNAGSYIP